MENPRSRVTIRRHASLPDPRTRSTFLQTRARNTFRTNPYVGWFRHSPSSTTTKPKYNTKANFLKASPYVGWFRHAPPSSFLAMCYAELSQELISTGSPKCHGDVFMLSDLISGHLKGGSGKPKSQFSPNSRNSPLAGHGLFSNLSTWLMTPFREEFEDAPKRIECEYTSSHTDDEQDYDDDDDESTSSQESLDDYDSSSAIQDSDSVGTRPDVGVSSQADAYFTHQYTSLIMNDTSELDDVITQMDIMRMTRNASRHLDVESIFKLPTMIYRSRTRERMPPTIPEASASSWMIVQGSTASEMTSAAAIGAPPQEEDPHEADTCVICLERFENGDHLRVLPCNHSFHVGCIDRWLSGSHSFMECDTTGCPTCKSRPTPMDDDDSAVPSWAFDQVGSAMARSSIEE